ncbi:asparagine synthase C-terminal domain-containing protein [Myxococcus stipitatus]|uniref:asparagine synthase-related protein n=1 Tax=Myxococcus stipitatus TaxID=83455 RepID=UPI001F456CC2|nr:asparagine synthase C-terminal domain-containing protein [Myxococcus stipitatus]MCE9668802.1 asparagine synthase C-terminal domain-containing protein [Myxococcus stipitatus]
MSSRSGDASGPLATLPGYRPVDAPASPTVGSVWEMRTGPRPSWRGVTGLGPEAIAAALLHLLPAEASLFQGLRREPPPLPRLRRETGSTERTPTDDVRPTLPDATSSSEAQRTDMLPASAPTDTLEEQGVGSPPEPRHTRQLPRSSSEARLHPASATDEHRAARLLAALSEAVRLRMEAGVRDVSLSGGVDSATLCMLAARHAPGRVRAWTMDVHFADEVERRHARTVARAAGVELVDIPIPDAVLPELFEPAVLSNESVIINARAVASFAFYEGARKHGAAQLLSGAGADEVLLGNPGAIASATTRIEEDRRLARLVLRSPLVDNLGMMPWAGTPEVSEEVRYAAWVLRELVLPPELRGARAHGITVHTPYLDATVADVALALPESSLARDGQGKWLFRHAVRGLVPDEVRLARKTPRYGHTALSSPVRTRWLELYRAWLAPARLEPLEVIAPGAVLAMLDRYARLSPESPEAPGVDRLLMRVCSLAMLHAHASSRPSCPES